MVAIVGRRNVSLTFWQILKCCANQSSAKGRVFPGRPTRCRALVQTAVQTICCPSFLPKPFVLADFCGHEKNNKWGTINCQKRFYLQIFCSRGCTVYPFIVNTNCNIMKIFETQRANRVVSEVREGHWTSWIRRVRRSRRVTLASSFNTVKKLVTRLPKNIRLGLRKTMKREKLKYSV